MWDGGVVMEREEARREIAGHVRDILVLLGEDPAREGLSGTPDRVARFYLNFLKPAEANVTTFAAETYDQLVVVKDIKGWSLCEHHLLPFKFAAHVGYIPRERVIGVSKIPRIVLRRAARLQLQERLTDEVAHVVSETTGARGVIVVVEGKHTCVAMRGVERDVTMITSSLVGIFQDDLGARQEFLSLIGRR